MKRNPMKRSIFQCGLIAAAIGAVALTGCEEEIEPRGDAPERVEAVFDPDTSTIPLPNDAAMDSGRLPTLPGAGEGTAEGEFLAYLPQLAGWLPTMPIEIPFSGPLDEETITEESVRFFLLDDGDLEPAEVEDFVYTEDESGASVIRLLPEEALMPGQQYAVAVTKDLFGANGNAVIESQALFFAASREALVDADGNSTISVLDDETAMGLEGLRQLLAPVFEGLEAHEVDRDDVAMAFRWTVSPETVASFDPDSSRVPIPNTAALDPDGTFPAAATCFAGENTANGHFDDYLAGLSGWPDATPITMPLSGPIDEASIGDDDVQLWRLEGETWERVEDITVVYLEEAVDNCTGEVSEETYSLAIQFDPGMTPREHYFAFATRGIESIDGRALLPEVPLFLGMQPYPVVDEQGESLVSALADEQAQALAGLQAVMAPTMAFLDSELGLDHNDLASVWNWYTWDDTFVVFDPTEGIIPFPNAFLIEDGTVNIPIPEGADPLTTGILQTLNQRTGFSTTAAGWIPLDGEVDPTTVGSGSVALAPEDGASSQLLTDDEYRVSYEPEWGHVVVEPLVPLTPRKLHAGIVTQDMLGANGRPVQPTPAFVFLRSPQSLIDSEGNSIVYALDDETAQALEPARNQYSQLFFLAVIIDGQRFTRNRIVNAWAFDTEDPAQALLEYRALAMDLLSERDELTARRACDGEGDCQAGGGDDDFVEIEDGEFQDPNSATDYMVDMSNVRAVHLAGEFQSVNLSMADGTVEESEDWVGITVYLPEEDQGDTQCEAPYDVVITQHGLGGDRWQGLSQANELAANCLATVAMDFPLHGGRADGADSLHPATTPAGSGAGFLSPDLLTSKNNFGQAIVDLFVLSRIIQGEDGESGLEPLFQDVDDDGPYFSTNLGYMGVSLGGIVGVPFVGLVPAVDTSVISVAGGRFAWILEGDEEGESTIGGSILDAFGEMGIFPGDFAFIRTMALVQWTADVIDPFALAPTAVSGDRRTVAYDADAGEFGPVVGETCDNSDQCPSNWRCEDVGGDDVCVEYLPEAHFLLQMAEGDRTIVNRSTIALAEALGVSLEDTTYEDVPHSFVSVRDPALDGYEEGLCARLQAASWLSSGLMGATELALTASECLQ